MHFRSRLIACSLLFALPHPAHADTLPLRTEHTSDTLPTESVDCGRRCDAPVGSGITRCAHEPTPQLRCPAPEGSAPPRRGRTSDTLTTELDPLPASEPGAAFLSAQHIAGRQGEQIEASGEVELRQDGRVLNADHLTYEQPTQTVKADGHVRVEQADTQMSGPTLQLDLLHDTGVMETPQFVLGEQAARGEAERAEMTGKNRYTLHSASYTTCPAGNDDWLLNVSRLELDRNTQVGVAHHAWVEFKGVPLLYTPWMDFGLNDDRRSGFLGPVLGKTNSGGTEITVPYYWNIAPNLDATFSPRLISQRGLQLNNEFRYLRPAFRGELEADVLPHDKAAQRDRVHVAWRHSQDLGHGFSAAINLNKVSDDDYFRDLSNAVVGTSQINLLREGVVSYAGGGWNASARLQRYQTLQDPLAPVAVPYRRLPQINLNGQQALAGANLALTGEFVDYRHPTLVNGRRLVLHPSVSYPLLNAPGYFLTPKLGVHYTRYALGNQNPSNLPDSTRTVPIFSLDSGLVFERNDSFFGTDLTQTLEPRAYYVRIPFREQSQMPNFDTAIAPFTFGQLFSENRFLGHDRIGDANMLTLGLTSRTLTRQDGSERLRMVIAERFFFDSPRVNLVAPSGRTTRSDILALLEGQLTKAWRLDSQWQYNPRDSYTQNYNLAARYQPEAGKVLNLGYRYTREALRQVDASAQWPLAGRWHGVGRLNYSLRDSRILEALAGLEYNASCWALRLVAQSFATATDERTTGFFVQLELNDLVRIGSDPLNALRASVPGYTKLNE